MSIFDSRKFSTPRLRSKHGYSSEPIVNDTFLGGRIPSFGSYRARVVEARKKLWLIWSPNSSQDPYYPGPAHPSNGVPVASAPEQRRTDGHGGKWDYTRVPQPYTPTRPWLGMITREGTQETSSVEFVSGATVWTSTSETEGRLQPDYLLSLADRNEAIEQATTSQLPGISQLRFLDQRPIYPRRGDIERLSGLRVFDRAMDALIECQRGVKEKQAWLTFATKWTESPPQSERRTSGGVNPADDTLIGVWVNGKVTDLVDWYLVEAYVPCYFISELHGSLKGARVRESFLEGTNVESLLDNEFERIANAQKMQFTPIELYFPLEESLRPSRDLDRAAASLHWQLNVPWACPLHDADSVEDALHRLEIPPVSSDAVSKGQWTVFAEEEPDEDEPEVGPLMRSRGGKTRGKGDMEGDEEMWYDRKLKRKLIFSDLPALPRVLEHVDEEFGRPVPGWVFGGRRHQEWISVQPSVWMYRREKASRHRVGERYSPPTPMMLSPQPEKAVMEESRPTTTIPATRARDVSPSEGSVVSLGPEEDGEMEDVEKKGTPAREDETTYVLIRGHSFAFGLGDLRLWLRHPNTAVETASIAGIYRLLQSDYRVDYFFEVRNARDAALLLSAGERNARSSGARYLSREGFERATSGLQRYGVESTPPPEVPVKERAKLPNFRRNVPPKAPQDTRRASEMKESRPRDENATRRSGIAGENSHDRRPPGLGNAFVEVPPLPGIEAEVLPRLACEERDPGAHLMTNPINVDDLPRDSLNLARGGVLRPTTDDLLRGARYPHSRSPFRRNPSPRRRANPGYEPPFAKSGAPTERREFRSDERQISLANRLADPETIGRFAARTTWDPPLRTPPTAPRAERVPAPAAPRSVPTRPLQDRLSDPKKPLLERLQTQPDKGKRDLMARMEVGLKEHISVQAPKGHRRAHNRPKKRLERILRWEEEMRLEWEEFRWTDAEIDWIIDQEELLPSLEDEEADDRMNED
ncbi:hypothetical protein B0H14DRAFT_3501611 [Mycena olivaceomarginata]|nr:hypothetical protein B0H14DRAFT_3501611 [Mycena olivaceomarginata]